MELETFSKWSISEIVLLVATFLLGMSINLFIDIPSNILSAAFWDSPSTWIIRAHMVVGTAILAISILLLANSYKIKYLKPIVKKSSLAGLVSVVFAYACGFAFLFFGTNDIFSYLMATGFIAAIVSYMIIALESRHERR